ncbi:MAG: c-type cytochrome [Thermodesulfobacteriota bacterium]
MSGKALYQRACAACHGSDGTGAPQTQLGFDLSPPDFTDCQFAPREPNGDWAYVIREGGPSRAFSELMPAFGEALTKPQVQKILEHIRTFCDNKKWPRGELNLPRPLVTTKAFPEDELVISNTIDTDGLNSFSSKIIYEQRIGPRNQLELIVPLEWAENPASDPAGNAEWQSSVGDIGIAAKRVLYASLDTGAIVSAGGELFFPTGEEEQGFGSGTAVFEPYVSYGQILPAECFFHLQGGFGLPFDNDEANEKAFWRGTFGHSISTGKYGRAWSPMVGLLGSRELVSEGSTHYDVTPQLQVALNTRQNVRLGAGARVPINDTDTRETEYVFYVLWDWFDGSAFVGW